MAKNQELLIDRTQGIIDAAYPKLDEYFLENASAVVQEGRVGHIDYVSIYTRTQAEYDGLDSQATAIGKKILDKSGALYEFSDIALATSAIRICLPNPENTRLGGVDFVFDDFDRVKREVPVNAPKVILDPNKSLRNSAEGRLPERYTLLQVDDPGSLVTISFLSRSFIDIVHKTQPN